MKILRGRHAGQTGRVHQVANDWMSVDLDSGRQGVIVRPDQIKLDPAEHDTIILHAGVGTFWQEWKLNGDGTFTALRERQPRRSPRQQTTVTRPQSAPGGEA